jgi:hypothetical protein
MADELAASDPELASILGVFNRLAWGEAIPAASATRRPVSRPRPGAEPVASAGGVTIRPASAPHPAAAARRTRSAGMRREKPERKLGPAGTQAGNRLKGVMRLLELVGGTGSLGWVIVKVVLIFAVAVIGRRLGERRTLAQLGAFDFAVAVAIGVIIGRTVTTSSASFATGAVALVTLLVVHRLVAFARRHSRIARIIDHPPRVLVTHGKIQDREAAASTNAA